MAGANPDPEAERQRRLEALRNLAPHAAEPEAERAPAQPGALAAVVGARRRPKT